MKIGSWVEDGYHFKERYVEKTRWTDVTRDLSVKVSPCF